MVFTLSCLRTFVRIYSPVSFDTASSHFGEYVFNVYVGLSTRFVSFKALFLSGTILAKSLRFLGVGPICFLM